MKVKQSITSSASQDTIFDAKMGGILLKNDGTGDITLTVYAVKEIEITLKEKEILDEEFDLFERITITTGTYRGYVRG